MACTTCGDICTLIDTECLCLYSPLKGFDIADLGDVVEDANAQLLEVTVCDLCEGLGEEGYEYQDIIDDKRFKRYYAKLIYYNWLIAYGSGKASKVGVISKEADDFSDFRVHGSKELQYRISTVRDQISTAEAKFLEFFKESHSSCFDEETDCDPCENKDCASEYTVVKNGSSHAIYGLTSQSLFDSDDEMASF